MQKDIAFGCTLWYNDPECVCAILVLTIVIYEKTIKNRVIEKRNTYE